MDLDVQLRWRDGIVETTKGKLVKLITDSLDSKKLPKDVYAVDSVLGSLNFCKMIDTNYAQMCN